MFQNYSLLPWLSVNDNVKLAIKTVFPKMTKSDVADKIDHYVKMVKLDHAGANSTMHGCARLARASMPATMPSAQPWASRAAPWTPGRDDAKRPRPQTHAAAMASSAHQQHTPQPAEVLHDHR